MLATWCLVEGRLVIAQVTGPGRCLPTRQSPDCYITCSLDMACCTSSTLGKHVTTTRDRHQTAQSKIPCLWPVKRTVSRSTHHTPTPSLNINYKQSGITYKVDNTLSECYVNNSHCQNVTQCTTTVESDLTQTFSV